MEAEDLKGLPAHELQERIQKVREEIFNLRFKAVTEPVTDPAGLKSRRRDVAVMRTVLRQQELGQQELAAAATGNAAAGSAGAGPAKAVVARRSRLGREGRQRARDAAAGWQENRAEQARKRGPAKRLGSKAKAAARAAKNPGRKPKAGAKKKKS